MNGTLAFAIGVAVALLAHPFTRRSRDEIRLVIGISIAAFLWFGFWIFFEIFAPPLRYEVDGGWALLFVLLLAGSSALMAFFTSLCKTGLARSLIASLGVVAVLASGFGFSKLSPPPRYKERKEPFVAKVEFPPIGYIAVSRKTGQPEAKIVDHSFNITTGNGDKGPGVRVQFDQGVGWFLVDYAWDRWTFEKPDLVTPRPPASIAQYLGSKLYSHDGARYSGKVVDIDSNHATLGAAIHVEWFNGKREWLSLQDARRQWALK